ncbi:hypothetical protein HAX54_044748 [Datura stramonium]|uniref:Uncharacterized protein n=1 Tax=Datura stramonium TaxID=4076 RepID=A0ABS8WHA3_DATST|nr:hypothetical protein [Datura stramonium]
MPIHGSQTEDIKLANRLNREQRQGKRVRSTGHDNSYCEGSRRPAFHQRWLGPTPFTASALPLRSENDNQVGVGEDTRGCIKWGHVDASDEGDRAISKGTTPILSRGLGVM